MSGGGSTQLSVRGAQDELLTKTPKFVPFYTVHDQVTPFAMEFIRQNINGTSNFGKNVNCEIYKNGDFLHQCELEITIPAVTAYDIAESGTERVYWAPNLAHTILKKVELIIGTYTVCKHYGIWYDVINEFTMPEEKRKGYNELIGQQNEIEEAVNSSTLPQMDITYSYSGLQSPLVAQPSTVLTLPFKFWFNEHLEQVLPVSAMAFSTIRFEMEFRQFEECIIYNIALVAGEDHSIQNVEFWANYLFIVKEDREKLMAKKLEYVMTQLQYNYGEGITSQNVKIQISFSHPGRSLYWFVQEDDAIVDSGGARYNKWNEYETTSSGGATPGLCPVTYVKLTMNGVDRINERRAEHFTRGLPYYFHTRVPKSKGLLYYPFTPRPEEIQNYSTLNFSRIGQFEINMKIRYAKSQTVHVFLVNVQWFNVGSAVGAVQFNG